MLLCQGYCIFPLVIAAFCSLMLNVIWLKVRVAPWENPPVVKGATLNWHPDLPHFQLDLWIDPRISPICSIDHRKMWTLAFLDCFSYLPTLSRQTSYMRTCSRTPSTVWFQLFHRFFPKHTCFQQFSMKINEPHETSQGLVNVPFWGFWTFLNISQTNIWWRLIVRWCFFFFTFVNEHQL